VLKPTSVDLRLVVDDVGDDAAGEHQLVLGELNLTGSEALHFASLSAASRARRSVHGTAQLGRRPVREEDQGPAVQLVAELERVADSRLDVRHCDERSPPRRTTPRNSNSAPTVKWQKSHICSYVWQKRTDYKVLQNAKIKYRPSTQIWVSSTNFTNIIKNTRG